MKRSYYWGFLVLIPALVGGYVACAGEDGMDDAEMTAEAESEAAIMDMPLIGSYRAETFGGGGVTLLALKTDRTFHREIGLVCVKEPCEPEQAAGAYVLRRRDGETFLVLMNADGALIDRYQYILKGDYLLLLPVGRSSEWETLKRSRDTWCGVPTDCSLQNIPKVHCTQGWACEEAICRDPCIR